MKIQPECVPCLIKRVIFETELHNTDPKKKTESIQKACSLIGKLYDPAVCSAEIATKVHKMIYELLEDPDPYSDLKQQSNEVALALKPTITQLIQTATDPLKAAMLCAIIGNSLDYGISGGSEDPHSLKQEFQDLYDRGVAYDDYPLVKKYLDSAKELVFFTDNCGEIVFDYILCEQLKKIYPTLKISVVVRGAPIISDATIDDAEALGFSDLVDQVLTTGCFAIGINVHNVPYEVQQVLSQSDLIICKGMANYEAFSETSYSPICYLLRSKCIAIARSMQVPLHENIIKMYP